MKRIDTSTAESDTHGSGKDGFTNGSTSPLVAPTEVDADWFNGVQEEIAGAIEDSGRTLDGADLAQLAAYLQSINCSAFGDGSDADPNLSSGTTTLSRDMYYENLTLSGTAVLQPSGYRIFVRNRLTMTGSARIEADGGAGSGSTAGAAAYASASLVGGAAGADGGAAAANGSAASTVQDGLGGPGGNGGDGDGGTNSGGAAADLNTPTSSDGAAAVRHSPCHLGYVLGSSGLTPIAGGSGGGGGGGGASGTGEAGGGGGAPGGVLSICARILTMTAGTTIRANGGSGGAGGGIANGSGGGGGGGGGLGLIATRYRDIAGTVQAIGGSGGPGGTGGSSGTDGTDGTVVYFDL